jgi:hypothetical protein
MISFRWGFLKRNVQNESKSFVRIFFLPYKSQKNNGSVSKRII